MAKLIYVANTSLDGYNEDPDGGIDFGAPDEEYFSFINDIERSVGTYPTDAACTRQWSSGRPHLSLTSRPGSWISPTSRERPKSSSSRRRCHRCQRPDHP